MKRKNKYLLSVLIILILTISLVYYWERKYISYLRINHEIGKINTDSLSKYYQLFRLSVNYNDYDIEDFLKFIKPKNSLLFTQLIDNDIKLSSPKNAEKIGAFDGFYHIGPDGKDDKDTLNIIFPRKSLNGDIGLDLKNFFNITRYNNDIYLIDDNSIYEHGKFNYNDIVKRFKNCKTDLKIKDADNYVFENTVSLINGRIETSSQMDKKTLDVILRDSLFLNLSKKYKTLFISFRYMPIDYFYCSDN